MIIMKSLTFAKLISFVATFHPLFSVVCTASPLNDTFQNESYERDGKTGAARINFNSHENLYLKVAVFKLLYVESVLHCALQCARERTCFSFNLARSADEYGLFECQLLQTDMYNASANLEWRMEFDHFGILNPCLQNPCLNGGTCRPVYEANDFRCICPKEFIGKRCQRENISNAFYSPSLGDPCSEQCYWSGYPCNTWKHSYGCKRGYCWAQCISGSECGSNWCWLKAIANDDWVGCSEHAQCQMASDPKSNYCGGDCS